MDSDNDSNDFDDDDVSPNNALNQNQDNEVTEEERVSTIKKNIFSQISSSVYTFRAVSAVNCPRSVLRTCKN